MKTFEEWLNSAEFIALVDNNSFSTEGVLRLVKATWQTCTAEHEAAAREIGPDMDICWEHAPHQTDKSIRCGLGVDHEGQHCYSRSTVTFFWPNARDREKAAVAAALEESAREVYEAYSRSTSGEVKFAAASASNRIRALIIPDHAAALQRHTDAAVEKAILDRKEAQ